MPSPRQAQSVAGRGFASAWALLAGLVAAGRADSQEAEPAVVQELLSANPTGASGNGDSENPAMSGDGEAVAFQSTASDLVPEDEDRILDIFLKPKAGRLVLVSGNAAVKGNGRSFSPSLDAGGKLVLFASEADNLVRSDQNRAADVFVRNLGSGEFIRASVSSAGGEGNGPSDFGVLSASGNVAVFQSRAGNLAAPEVPAGTFRIHVRDLARGTTLRIDGEFPAGVPEISIAPDVSADGRRIVFQSTAPFTPGDRNGFEDIYLHDLITAQTVRVSAGPRDSESNGPSTNPRISADGRFVAFDSRATNIAGGGRKGGSEVYLRDLLAGTIERVTVGPEGGAFPFSSRLSDLNANGRIVVFTTDAPLVRDDGNGVRDVYARDRLIEMTILVSSARFPGGPPMTPDGPSQNGVASADGKRFAFDSRAPRILPQDQAPNADIFRAELERPVDGPFPPANFVFAAASGSLIQLDLSGNATGLALDLPGPFGGAAVDEANALWVAAGSTVGRFQASTLGAGEGGPIVFQLPGEIRGLAAIGGAAFLASRNFIARVAPDAEPRFFGFRGDPETVAMALDPSRRLWVAAARPDANELLVFSRQLSLTRSFRRDPSAVFIALAFDPRGNLLARGKSFLTKLAPAGGELWSVPLPAGDGVAADGEGNAYTLTERAFLAFNPHGDPLFSLPHALGLPPAGTQIAVAGDGSVWAFLAGRPVILKVLPGGRPPQLLTVDFRQPLGPQAGSDLTGFLAANVTSRGGDMDGDGFTNGVETRNHANPFDPQDPPLDRRLRPVLDLTASSLGGRQVRLDWTSPDAVDFFFVFRDGRPVRGSPFSFSTAFRGIIDPNVPGGPHTYRVIAQGSRGGGGGGGLDESGDIPEPFSFTTEATLTLGEGALRALAGVDPPPDAVAFDPVAGRIFAALQGGFLLTLDTSLQFIEDAPLPADPFASNDVRGMAIDLADPGRPLFLLLADGRVFRKVGAADPVLDVTFDMTPSAGGFTGLAIVDDLFATMVGPDFDCLIGLQRAGGDVEPGSESSLSSTLGAPVDISIGLAKVGAALLAGTGAVPASTINDVPKLNLGPGLAVTDANAILPLSAIGSTDISGFDFAPGVGLIVADRSGSRIAILEAKFPGAPQVLLVTPPSGSFSGTTQVAIAGAGFGTDVTDLWVGFDGVEVPITSFSPGTQTITVDAEPLGEARAVELEVFSSLGSDSRDPGYIYGFQRGDANDDGSVDLSDAMRCLMYLFNGAAGPPCQDAADADDSEALNVTDAVRILDFLFMDGLEPPAPFPDFGLDPAGATLGCGGP